MISDSLWLMNEVPEDGDKLLTYLYWKNPFRQSCTTKITFTKKATKYFFVTGIFLITKVCPLINQRHKRQSYGVTYYCELYCTVIIPGVFNVMINLHDDLLNPSSAGKHLTSN